MSDIDTIKRLGLPETLTRETQFKGMRRDRPENNKSTPLF